MFPAAKRAKIVEAPIVTAAGVLSVFAARTVLAS
jgi:hypothetical protein